MPTARTTQSEELDSKLIETERERGARTDKCVCDNHTGTLKRVHAKGNARDKKVCEKRRILCRVNRYATLAIHIGQQSKSVWSFARGILRVRATESNRRRLLAPGTWQRFPVLRPVLSYKCLRLGHR